MGLILILLYPEVTPLTNENIPLRNLAPEGLILKYNWFVCLLWQIISLQKNVVSGQSKVFINLGQIQRFVLSQEKCQTVTKNCLFLGARFQFKTKKRIFFYSPVAKLCPGKIFLQTRLWRRLEPG